jgi:hypothetical protein
MVSQGISERQHINALRNYFNEDGTPKTTSFNIGGKDLVVPLYILADHSSIGLEELDIEFSCRLIFGDEDKEVSSLKKSLLGLFKKKGYEHNIKGIEVDSGFNPNETGMAKINLYQTTKCMKKLLILLGLCLSISATAQTVGSTKTEQYKASFETAIDIERFLDYEGKQIPIQILKAGISDEMYEMYPELKEKRVGLGVANITMEYLENLNRFKFTEDKTEIKNRMVKQFQASAAGISENKLDGRGKINLAEYFVTVECYDYSVSEDETINLKDGVKNLMVTRLGLQVRFTNAETGVVFGASGLGEAKTTRELTILSDATVDEMKFNQSTISIATKKALDIACARILDRMVKKGIFEK